MAAYLTPDDKWRLRAELKELSPEFVEIILFKEDKYFYAHPGVNPFAVVRALWYNTVAGKRTSGASTITMQVARLLEPRPRTYRSKLVEMFRALQLEWSLSKEEILALYVNLLPYGGNVEGVKSAAWLYFGAPPGALSLSQAVILAVAPNRPGTLDLAENNPALKQARDQWLGRLLDAGLFSESEIAAALAEPVRPERRAAPALAPHFCRKAAAEHPETADLYTTLDLRTQIPAQKVLQRYVERQYRNNITNAAALVIDNKTMQVKAWIGSADFYAKRFQGEVDGVTAARSPGSTLKPAVYALGIDLGLYTPKSVFLDVPFEAGGYAPENYDDQFRGRVTLEQALALSLNIPAVQALQKVGVDTFAAFMQNAGFRTIARDREKLGLSMILGGCGVSLAELVAFYAAFAREGRQSEIVYKQKEQPRRERRTFSPLTNYLVADMLTRPTRPDLPAGYLDSQSAPRIAWKTGTSYGRRDAWAVGFNPRYTVGVWVGNFDGSGSPALSGADKAAPLLFELFNLLDDSGEWFARPATLPRRKVCAKTGLVPAESCENIIQDDYLPGISNAKKCTCRKWVWTNAEKTVAYCDACMPPQGVVKSSYSNTPPELAAFYRERNLPFDAPPPHNPHCRRVFQSAGLRIKSPTDGAEIWLSAGQKLLLRAQAPPGTSRLYWYADGKFLGTATAGEPFFYLPAEGKLRVVCADDQGRSHEIETHVRLYGGGPN